MIEIHLPPSAEAALEHAFGRDLPTAAKEALAIEGYRSARLTAGQVAEMLGLGTSAAAVEWLARRGVPLNYDQEEYDADLRTLEALFPESHP